MAAPDPVQTFREEAADLLVELETALLSLEERPADRELLDRAFRALHTLKGSGAMFGFEAAAAFTHHLENAFDKVRKGEVAPNAVLVGIALAARDHIGGLIDAPERVDSTVGDALLARLADLMGTVAAAAVTDGPTVPVASAPVGLQAGVATWVIRFRLAPDCLVTGTNPILLLDEMRGLGQARVTALVDAVPPLDAIDPDSCYLAWEVVLTTDQPRSTIEDVFIFCSDGLDLSIEPASGQPVAAAASSGTAAAAPAAAADDVVARNGAGAASIKVAAERVDDLMDQVGELVIAQARLKQLVASSGDPQIQSIAEEIERLANGLRDTTMGIRMLPVAALFGRFRRLVRDLSRDLDKDVVLTMSGEETELDKTVIERLNDPLVHIVRNSLDHGIEPAAARLMAGKPAQGHVHLAASHAGTQVRIAIRDDGGGLDLARIRAKAEEQGLVAPGAMLSDGELAQLIFHPGFSTAQAVTSVSGRGVGMDVVKRTLDALRGDIDVVTEPGRGTCVTLSLPLTLAIIDGLLVRVGRGRYVLPLSAVEECVELTAGDDGRHQGRNFLNIRGELVPFLRLRHLFGATTPPDPYQKVVVISSGDRRVGLVVDQVLGDHQTVIKSLSKLHADVGDFSGATILGDGTVALILDVGQLVASGQAAELRREAV